MGDLAPILLAPFIGSFVGVLVARLPDGRGVLLARSSCDSCGARLGPAELVPLLSYLVLRGRCRHCRAPIGAFHPGVELAALGIALWAATEASGAALWLSCVLGWSLLALALIDARAFWLPDALTLPLLGLGLAGTAWLDPAALGDHAIGAVAGWAAFAGVAAGYRALRGREGLGGGDARLLGAAGAWLGWAALPAVVLGAALGGLAQAVATRAAGGDRIAFGVWLAAAMWVLWLYGVPG